MMYSDVVGVLRSVVDRINEMDEYHKQHIQVSTTISDAIQTMANMIIDARQRIADLERRLSRLEPPPVSGPTY